MYGVKDPPTSHLRSIVEELFEFELPRVCLIVDSLTLLLFVHAYPDSA